MSHRLLSTLLLTTLLLNGCAKEAPNAPRFTSVPLPEWSQDDQRASYALIVKRCCPVDPVRGDCPVRLVCPPDAYLERATLDYVRLRGENRAADGKGIAP